MVNTESVVTIDETTNAIISVHKEEKIGVISFSGKTDQTAKVSILFGDSSSIPEVINMLKALEKKMQEVESGIIQPNKEIIV